MRLIRATLPRLALPVALSTLIAAPALGDAERLERDLRAFFADEGELTIGEVSDALLRSRVTAEALRFDAAEGDRLLIDRYRVSGDYERPEEVTLEGVRLEDGLTELLLLGIDRLVLGEPGWAVPPGDDEGLAAMRLGSLAAEGLVIEHGAELAEGVGAEDALGEGRLAVGRLRGETLSREAIGRLELHELSGTGLPLEEMGEGDFTLDRLLLEDLEGLDREDEQRLGRLELEALEILVEGSRLLALEALGLDGDLGDGEAGLRLEALDLELTRLIELSPEEERTQMRMASNVLTDGSGQLRLDAVVDARWEEQDDETGRLLSESQLSFRDALRLDLDVEGLLALPEGMTHADLVDGERLLEQASLNGGLLILKLSDQGLFGRLATLGAAMEGVSEAQYLEQARTQAQGFGMMFGPQVEALLAGLVSLMEGSASELEVTLDLPAEKNLQRFADDPLALPDRLAMQVETR
ncbi:hypothetical protein [Halomonas ramblicola]|uniref:hypothetical protein n=1 Tax=Halomonas ramblicola TaxID=747349 RepID=UPI0025B5118B|nr:hypothetical protein [Halomonas ramblicola]MDN3521857.1 hypothetical protein [Halomonas ramblicola]